MTSNDGGAASTAELLTATIELGDALRELIETSVTTTAAAGEVGAAAELVRAATARISGAPRQATQLPRLDDPSEGRRVFNPVTGIAHPLAPPLIVRQEDGGVVAEITLGLAYEGPPTFVHGGMSALFMDQMLGSAAGAAGLWGMTAHLELDYRGPLPLQTALVLRARVESQEGRKAFISGTIALASAPEKVLVEARGLFVMPRPEKQAAYFGAVTDASGRHAPPRRPGDATALRLA
ncbi:Thioesterase superfamily protein [Blastococcus aggregatus]|uniref:Thioesterase superfamily protein n=1 Tax=Blastococcus aggregatus TaxID=38502 RepID=A0A285V9U3_9ACTN|nr:PaaI family thioesterase [Blastococcus aggregatus]SOC49281.1 Thioesterase superfamily protein [Blastococcus aggregatus]